MGKRGPKPKSVDTTWTPELAYVVGLFASDGNLGRDGLYLDITSVDIEVVQTVKEVLGLTNKIGVKKSGSGTFAYRVQFKRKILHEWLQSIGLTPAKSKTLGKLKIPDEYFFDFLRGVWDGDGCIYSYFDKRWKSSFMYYISIISASPDFIRWVQETTKRLVGVSGHTTITGNATQLKFAKHDASIIFDKMFYRYEIPHLPRKFAKAKKVFKLDLANSRKRIEAK